MRLVWSFLVASIAASLIPIGASAQLIQACVNRNGVPRIVSSASECDGKETLLTWNQQGVKGDKGDPGEPGPPGPTGPSLRLFDGDGNVLGIPFPLDADPLLLYIFNEQLELFIPLYALKGILAFTLYFESADCQGQAYFTSSIPVSGILWGPFPSGFPRFLVSRANELAVDVRVESYFDPSRGCSELSRSVPQAVPAHPFTGELPFTIPVPEPIYVGLAP